MRQPQIINPPVERLDKDDLRVDVRIDTIPAIAATASQNPDVFHPLPQAFEDSQA